MILDVPHDALPVDRFVEPLRRALHQHRAAVLTASPGAGKTTRLPPALVDRGLVLLLQPRRVAARAVATRIADEQGWTIGREVGWHIRFEQRFGADTRLLVVTEGILTAYLQDDPLLSRVATLVVDEFHERSIHADLGLALARQAWLARTDLHLLVMSATLDSAPVARFLGHCPVFDVPGLLHPLDISYAPHQPLAAAVDELLPGTEGHVLCFLPGAGEIARAAREVASSAIRHGADVVPLHGSLAAAAQDAALAASGTRQRIILATNVAETSLTVPGVRTVIDSGLQKVARYDAARGVNSLVTERITRDSADQRAGRAARLGPGVARRLWAARDRLEPHREPEIDRIDLSGPVLSLVAWGAELPTFEWFEAPAADRIDAALTLLTRLGATADGRITARGRQMERLPLHPRLARVLLEALGSFEGAAAAACLSESVRTDNGNAATTCDLLASLDAWQALPYSVRQIGQQLQRLATDMLGAQHRPHVDEATLRRALLAGYPDRVAKRRAGDAQRVTLATGHGAVMGRESGVRDGDWLVALDVTAGRTTPHTEAIVRAASRVEPDWLSPTRVVTVQRVDANSGAAKAFSVQHYDALIISERPVPIDALTRAQLLAEAWQQRDHDEPTTRLLRRARFAGVDLNVTMLATTAAHSATRLDDIDVGAAVPWDVRQVLDRDAPDTLLVPSGRHMRVHYRDDGGVEVAVKLQELFGLADTPRLGPRRVPVTFHLLAPNGRPVQTTQDLRSFWERTYIDVRKELRGRYPRHPWPDDPWTATATHRARKRGT